jgi:DNA replication protein DnaC
VDNNPSPSLLVLAGNPGCGKTALTSRLADFTRAAAIKAWERGGWKQGAPRTLWCRWPAVADLDQENQTMIESMCEIDTLYIDDIGAEQDPWKNATNKLCQILTRRERRFTVLSTNIHPSQWTEKFDARVQDRLFRNSEVADMFDVPSFSTRS